MLAVIAVWGTNKQILGLFHDDGIYAVVAQSLARGDGYRIISLPSAPAQTKYPFLYSYLLSWLWWLDPSFPQNIVVLKALNSAILAAIFVCGVLFYRRHFPNAQFAALMFGALICTNPIIFTYIDYVVSDLLFVLLALGALALSTKPAASTANMVLVAGLAGLACLTRLAAAPLALAGAIWAMITSGRRGALYFCGGILLFIAPWILWMLFHTDPSVTPLFSYYSAYNFAGAENAAEVGEWRSRLWPVVVGNARYLLDSFDLLYLLPLMPWLAPFVAALTLAGMIVSVRRQDLFAWTFLLMSLALLLVWPFHPGRYIAPLVPLLVLFLFRGMAMGERWIRTAGEAYPLKEWLAKIIWLPALLVFLLNGIWLSSYLLIQDDQTTRGLYGRRVPYGWEGFEESFAWIRRNTKTDARLATAYDPMYFLYTGRQAIRPALHRPASYFYPYGQAKPEVGSPAEIKTELANLRIDYLIIDPLDGYAEAKATIKLLDEVITFYGDRAKKVFTSTDGKHRIYGLSND